MSGNASRSATAVLAPAACCPYTRGYFLTCRVQSLGLNKYPWLPSIGLSIRPVTEPMQCCPAVPHGRAAQCHPGPWGLSHGSHPITSRALHRGTWELTHKFTGSSPTSPPSGPLGMPCFLSPAPPRTIRGDTYSLDKAVCSQGPSGQCWGHQLSGVKGLPFPVVLSPFLHAELRTS